MYVFFCFYGRVQRFTCFLIVIPHKFIVRGGSNSIALQYFGIAKSQSIARNIAQSQSVAILIAILIAKIIAKYESIVKGIAILSKVL